MPRKVRSKVYHCGLCGKATPSYCKTFKAQMNWLKRHRKRKHGKK